MLARCTPEDEQQKDELDNASGRQQQRRPVRKEHRETCRVAHDQSGCVRERQPGRRLTGSEKLESALGQRPCRATINNMIGAHQSKSEGARLHDSVNLICWDNHQARSHRQSTAGTAGTTHGPAAFRPSSPGRKCQPTSSCRKRSHTPQEGWNRARTGQAEGQQGKGRADRARGREGRPQNQTGHSRDDVEEECDHGGRRHDLVLAGPALDLLRQHQPSRKEPVVAGPSTHMSNHDQDQS